MVDFAQALAGQPQKRTSLQTIGRGLSGLSAGLQGIGPQYLQSLAQQDQAQAQEQKALSAERLKAMAVDAQRVSALLQKGDTQGALRVIDNRTAAIKQLGGDASDTLRIRQLIASGLIPNAQAEINEFLGAAQQYGLIEIAKPEEFTLSPGQARFRGSEQVAAVPAATPDQFEVLSPEQAAALGLPSDKQFKRNKITNDVSQIGSGPAVQVNTGNPTEGERTAGILANRLDFAQSQINDVLAKNPQAAGPGALPTALSALGMDYLARVSNPAERQIIEAAQDDMLDAALTLGTGAAYTAEQFRAYKRSYFPQLGDDEEAIKSKAERLTNLLNAAYTKAGRGAPEQRLSGAAPGGGEAPPATDLTPDEQAELAELRARYRGR